MRFEDSGIDSWLGVTVWGLGFQTWEGLGVRVHGLGLPAQPMFMAYEGSTVAKKSRAFMDRVALHCVLGGL